MFAHITLGMTPAQRGRILAKIKDKNPILVSDPELDNVITYYYEGDLMGKVVVPIGRKYYHMELDLDVHAMYVRMSDYDGPIESVVSENGEYIVDFYWGKDGMPVVVGLEMLNTNKVSIIHDWIEDGVEAALTQLNEHPRHEFEDNHWKSVLTSNG
jgi:hypothetical protein